MDIKKVECPYCGASLKIAEGQNLAVCDHCDKAVMIDDGVIRVQKTVRNIDEFQFAKFEYEKAQVEDEKKKRKKLYLVWTISVLVVLGIMVFLGKVFDEGWLILPPFVVPIPLGLLFPTGKVMKEREETIKLAVVFALWIIFFAVGFSFATKVSPA